MQKPHQTATQNSAESAVGANASQLSTNGDNEDPLSNPVADHPETPIRPPRPTPPTQDSNLPHDSQTQTADTENPKSSGKKKKPRQEYYYFVIEFIAGQTTSRTQFVSYIEALRDLALSIQRNYYQLPDNQINLRWLYPIPPTDITIQIQNRATVTLHCLHPHYPTLYGCIFYGPPEVAATMTCPQNHIGSTTTPGINPEDETPFLRLLPRNHLRITGQYLLSYIAIRENIPHHNQELGYDNNNN